MLRVKLYWYVNPIDTAESSEPSIMTTMHGYTRDNEMLEKTQRSGPSNGNKQRGITPRKRDPAATRARILDAATQEFCAKGFDGARMEQIVARAECNIRMAYHYFLP